MSRWPGGEYYYDSILVATDERLITMKIVTTGRLKKQTHLEPESRSDYSEMAQVRRDQNTGALAFEHDPQEWYLLPNRGGAHRGEEEPRVGGDARLHRLMPRRQNRRVRLKRIIRRHKWRSHVH